MTPPSRSYVSPGGWSHNCHRFLPPDPRSRCRRAYRAPSRCHDFSCVDGRHLHAHHHTGLQIRIVVHAVGTAGFRLDPRAGAERDQFLPVSNVAATQRSPSAHSFSTCTAMCCSGLGPGRGDAGRARHARRWRRRRSFAVQALTPTLGALIHRCRKCRSQRGTWCRMTRVPQLRPAPGRIALNERRRACFTQTDRHDSGTTRRSGTSPANLLELTHYTARVTALSHSAMIARPQRLVRKQSPAWA
ncbi:hypothetical protein XBLMG947_0232 [Xanthomonas bromi]|uniref:Uncharacterized protein n=1 Tax=Xanthomonas bromi TaxID=56449 RepID=A0A1C3NGD3_9XANT|nr:hypothetical protein XBLMG947_0232 [Xanthomonas bromi]